MKEQVIGTRIICDGCGCEFESSEGFVCFANDPYGDHIEQEAENEEWKIIGEKHYCPNCYSRDENDHIHTKDGKVWDEETEEEITDK